MKVRRVVASSREPDDRTPYEATSSRRRGERSSTFADGDARVRSSRYVQVSALCLLDLAVVDHERSDSRFGQRET